MEMASKLWECPYCGTTLWVAALEQHAIATAKENKGRACCPDCGAGLKREDLPPEMRDAGYVDEPEPVVEPPVEDRPGIICYEERPEGHF